MPVIINKEDILNMKQELKQLINQDVVSLNATLQASHSSLVETLLTQHF